MKPISGKFGALNVSTNVYNKLKNGDIHFRYTNLYLKNIKALGLEGARLAVVGDSPMISLGEDLMRSLIDSALIEVKEEGGFRGVTPEAFVREGSYDVIMGVCKVVKDFRVLSVEHTVTVCKGSYIPITISNELEFGIIRHFTDMLFTNAYASECGGIMDILNDRVKKGTLLASQADELFNTMLDTMFALDAARDKGNKEVYAFLKEQRMQEAQAKVDRLEKELEEFLDNNPAIMEVAINNGWKLNSIQSLQDKYSAHLDKQARAYVKTETTVTVSPSPAAQMRKELDNAWKDRAISNKQRDLMFGAKSWEGINYFDYMKEMSSRSMAQWFDALGL